MQLSVIIVNHNVKYFLEQCLCSVQKACSNINAEIFVVDNDSTDDSKAYLEPRFPSVNFIWNKSNIGFAKANNQAVALAKGAYILFLNPDTIVPEDCFEKCIEFFGTHPNAGAMGIHMIDGSGKFLKESKRAFPSPFTSLFKLTGLARSFPRSRVFARYYLGHLSENENHEVDVLAGAFMMIPKRVLDQTGSFDEIFFMYGEDVDLSYRIQQAGFKNFYFAESSIIHFKGESTKKGSLNYVRLFYKAMGLFVKKHYSTGRAQVFNILIRVGIFLRAILTFVSRILQLGWTTLSRWLSRRVRRPDENNQTIILSDEKDFEMVTALMNNAGMQERILGRVYNGVANEGDTLGGVGQIKDLVKKYPVKELIFCEEGLGFAKIIAIIQDLSPGIRNKFHASGSDSIVGSDSKDLNGEYVAG